MDQGELLIRIRDEAKSTIEAYKYMFDDSQMYNTRKARTVNNGVHNAMKSYKSDLSRSVYFILNFNVGLNLFNDTINNRPNLARYTLKFNSFSKFEFQYNLERFIYKRFSLKI